MVYSHTSNLKTIQFKMRQKIEENATMQEVKKKELLPTRFQITWYF